MGMNEFEAGVVGRIKASMKTRGLTQEELAKSVGVKQYAVSRMLSISPFPTVEQLALIANALDVSLYYLIGIQEESIASFPRKRARSRMPTNLPIRW